MKSRLLLLLIFAIIFALVVPNRIQITTAQEPPPTPTPTLVPPDDASEAQPASAPQKATQEDQQSSEDSLEVLETLTVPVDGTSVQTSFNLAEGVVYTIRVSGIYKWGNCDPINCPNGGPDYIRLGDAEYLTDDNWQSFSDPFWSGVVYFEVNGSDPDFGPFSPEHVYSIQITGNGQPATFRIHDCSYCYPDNDGALTVEILQEKLDLSVVINVPQELSVNDDGWYAENPTELRVMVTNNTTEVFLGVIAVTFSSSNRLVFGDIGQAPSILTSFVALNPGESAEQVWPMWVQPMSQQSIVFTGKVFDDLNQLAGQSVASMSVPTAHIYPVVVVPGLLGSWKNFNGEWEIDPLTGRYNNLLDELRLAGYENDITLFTFPYDWRQHVNDSGIQLGEAISEFLTTASASGRDYVDASSVDIMAHSLGGLVSRAYIQGGAYGENVHRLVTLGTPHRGAPEAYLSAEGLVFISEGFPIIRNIKDAAFRALARKDGFCTNLIRAVCLSTNADVYRYILDRVPSSREIFPESSYLIDDPGGYLVDNDDPTRVYPFDRQVNSFLDALNENIDLLFSRLDPSNVIAVVGDQTDPNTDSFYKVVEQGQQDTPLWRNGRVQRGEEFRPQGQGDETVPTESADLSLVDARARAVVVSFSDNESDIVHGNMPTQLQQSIITLLTNTRPFFASGFLVRYFDPPVRNPLLFYNLSPVEIQIMDPLGKRTGVDFSTGDELTEIPDAFFSRSNLVNEPDFIFIADPLEGEYSIELQGTMEGNYTVGMETLSEEGTLTVAEFSGATSPGATHQHTAVYDRETLPIAPLSLVWHPPLDDPDKLREVVQDATLPIKFTVRDAQDSFVADESVFVWVVDPTNPSSTVAAFSVDSPGLHGQSDMVRIDLDEEQYIVDLHLKDYNFEPDKIYIVGAGVYGQQLGARSFIVLP